MPPSRESRASTRSSSGGSYIDESDSKWNDSPSSSRRSLKDDMKQQMKEMKTSAKQKGAQVKESVQEALDDTDSTLYSLRNRVVSVGDNVSNKAREKGADLLEEEVEPRLEKAVRAVQNIRRNLRSGATRSSQLQQQQRGGGDEEPDDDEEDEEDEEDYEEVNEDDASPSDWKQSLKSTGSSLLNKASDATSALRSRINEVAPGIERGIKQGVKQAKGKWQAMNEDNDDELPPEESEEDDEEPAEDDEEESDISGTLRSGARRASNALDSAKENVKSKVDSATPEIKRTLNRARGRIEDAASDASQFASNKLKDTKDFVNDTKSRVSGSLNRALPSDDGADDEDQEIEEDKLDMTRQLKQRGAQLKNRGAQLVDQFKSKVQDMIPASDEEADQQESDDLDEDDDVAMSMDNEDFSVKLEPLRDSPAHLKHHGHHHHHHHHRRTAWSTPVLLIGALFAIWSLLSIYSWFVPAAVENPPNLYEQAKQFGHDMSHKTESNWERVKENTQQLADLIAGRKPEPTMGDRIMNFGHSIRASIFGTPVHHYDAHDAKNTLINGIGRVEHAIYRTVDKIEGEIIPEIKYRSGQVGEKLQQANDYAKSKVIPNARDAVKNTQEELKYHRDHASDYVDRARDAAGNLRDMAETKAEDMGLIRKKTFAERVWNWLGGGETRMEEAQRKASETYDRASSYAGDIKDRVQDGVESVRDTLQPKPKTLGEKIKSAFGYQPSARDVAEDYIDRAKDSVGDAKDQVKDYLNRNDIDINSRMQDLRDRIPSTEDFRTHIPSADDIKSRAYDLAHEAQDRVQMKRTLGERLKDGINSLLHPNQPTVADRLQQGATDLKDRVSDDLNGLKNRASQDLHGLKDRVEGEVHRRMPADRNILPNTYRTPEDDLHRELHEGTNIHPLEGAVPIDSVLSDIRGARSDIPSTVHKESLGERVRHVVKDGVDAIKSHLPGSNRHTAQVHPAPQYEQQQQPHMKDTVISGLHRAGETVERKIHEVESDVRSAAGRAKETASELADRLQREANEKLHYAKKNVEYAGNRIVHNGEKLGHRVEEGAEILGHRVEEKYDEAKDRVRYHMP